MMVCPSTFSAGWRGILDAGQLWLRPCSRRGARSVSFATFPDFFLLGGVTQFFSSCLRPRLVPPPLLGLPWWGCINTAHFCWLFFFSCASSLIPKTRTSHLKPQQTALLRPFFLSISRYHLTTAAMGFTDLLTDAGLAGKRPRNRR